MSALPKSTADKLDRIARDGHLGRRPTFAHPLCTCAKLILVPCYTCGAAAGDACAETPRDQLLVGLGPWLHWERRYDDGRPRYCPQNWHQVGRCPVHAPR